MGYEQRQQYLAEPAEVVVLFAFLKMKYQNHKFKVNNVLSTGFESLQEAEQDLSFCLQKKSYPASEIHRGVGQAASSSSNEFPHSL